MEWSGVEWLWSPVPCGENASKQERANARGRERATGRQDEGRRGGGGGVRVVRVVFFNTFCKQDECEGRSHCLARPTWETC